MKFFIAITVFALIAGVFADSPTITPEDHATLADYVADCLQDIEIAEEKISQMMNLNFTGIDYQDKCFLLCVFEHIGTFVDGVFQTDIVAEKMIPVIGATATETVIANCENETGDGVCDAAFNIFDCYMNNGAGIIV